MRIKFPTSYKITYPKENKSYFKGKAKREISQLLAEASAGYCMYCGRKVLIDNEAYYQVEHSIEQAGYVDGDSKKIPFTNCKFNLSLACMKCNQKYKNQMIERLPFNLVGKEINCKKQNCKEPCKEYLSAREEYIKLNKIILQPAGVKGENMTQLGIQYDLIHQIFVPLINKGISSSDVELIQEHIARFNLNGNTATASIIEACELMYRMIVVLGDNCKINDIINVLEGVPFEHILIKELREFVVSTIKDVRVLKNFCELCIVLSYI